MSHNISKTLQCGDCHDLFDERDVGIVQDVEMHDVGNARVRRDVMIEVCPTCGSDWLNEIIEDQSGED